MQGLHKVFGKQTSIGNADSFEQIFHEPLGPFEQNRQSLGINVELITNRSQPDTILLLHLMSVKSMLGLIIV